MPAVSRARRYCGNLSVDTKLLHFGLHIGIPFCRSAGFCFVLFVLSTCRGIHFLDALILWNSIGTRTSGKHRNHYGGGQESLYQEVSHHLPQVCNRVRSVPVAVLLERYPYCSKCRTSQPP